MMNEEDYLRRVRRALWNIQRKKRDEIILELRSEIDERLENGEKFEDILKDLPSPKLLKREYTEIYGTSNFMKLLFIISSIILSIFSTSVIPFTSIIFYGAPAILIFLALFLLMISMNFGIKVGLIASTISSILRFILIYVTSIYIPLQNGTLISEGLASLIIFLIPFLGKKK